MLIKTKLISTAAFVIGSWLLAAPAYATCGVNGYWGSECGPVTQPGDTTNTAGAIAGAVGIGTGIGVGHGGNSTATSTGGQGGAGGSATATGGSVTGSGNSSVTNRTTVNNTNKTRIKHAANMAAPVMTSGYGPANCFGDTNPSGQFGASIQTFGWGMTANSSKASNLCAMMAIAGPQAALSYLANVDPNVRRALLANGLAEKPSQRKERIAAEAGTPKNVRPAQTVRCPEGSTWDGKGCWVKNLRKVRR